MMPTSPDFDPKAVRINIRGQPTALILEIIIISNKLCIDEDIRFV